jgi:thiol:disulfide interchange protein DsbC
MNLKRSLVAASLLLTAMLAHADWAEELHQKFPATRGAVVAPAFAGFKSVVKGQEIVFVSDDQTIMISGDVIDLRTKTSLTQDLREKNRPKADLKLLRDTDAIELSKGKKSVRVLSDPDCPYCQQLEKSLAQLEGVRVLIFLYPLVSIHPNAARIAESVWCSPDRAKAWRDYMLLGKKPKEAKCENPIERVATAGTALQIQGTPALIFDDGSIVSGAISVEQIEGHIRAASGGAK